MLSQIQRDKERPIAFASRTLNASERAYSVGEREALACIWAVEHWHYYVYGRKFTLRTDHSSLTSLLGAGNTGRKPMRLLRWASRLQEYNFDVVYRPGKDNSVADCLSRNIPRGSRDSDDRDRDSDDTCRDPYIDSKTDELADESFLSTVFGSESLRALTKQELADATNKDQQLKLIQIFILNGWSSKKPMSAELSSFWDVRDELTLVNGCIFRGNRAVIPTELRKRVLELAHEGHCGIVKMKQRCRDTVWWPRFDRDVEEYCSNCTACVVSDKGTKPRPTPPLKPNPFPSNPWKKIAIDILGELHGIQGPTRYVLVLIDLYSKWPEVRAVTNITSHCVNQFLADTFARWGLPEEIISDNGRQFVSREFEEFLRNLNIKHSRTALYHPQANGAVERFNRVLKEGLRVGKYEGKPFESTLRSIIANYRSTVHGTTGMTPAELMIGRKLRMPLDLLPLHPVRRTVHFEETHKTVEQRVNFKQNQYKSYADDRRRAQPSNLKKGDRVRVRNPIRHNKLDPVWSSSHTIINKPSDDTATLEDGTTWNAERLMQDKSTAATSFNQDAGHATTQSNLKPESDTHADRDEPIEVQPEHVREEPQQPQLEQPRVERPRPERPRPEQPALRRSERTRNPPKRFEDFNMSSLR